MFTLHVKFSLFTLASFKMAKENDSKRELIQIIQLKKWTQSQAIGIGIGRIMSFQTIAVHLHIFTTEYM